MLRRHRLAWLLSALLCYLIATPLASVLPSGDLFAATMAAMLGVAAAYGAGAAKPRTLNAVLLLAVVWVGLHAPLPGAPPATITLLRNGALVLLLALTFTVVATRLTSAQNADAEVLCGAVAGYLILGLAWARSYEFLAALDHHAFRVGAQAGPDQSGNFIYFSLAALTTTSYGDLIPVTPFARIWSLLEAVAGMFYNALIVARLVSLYRGPAAPRD